MPTCVAFTTYHALDLLAFRDSWLLGGLGVNAVTTCLLGILDHKLSGPPSPSDSHAFASDVFGFVGFQVTGVIPTLLLIMWLVRMWIAG